MSEKDFRRESDSLGAVDVPAGAYYGVHSVRAAANFPMTGRMMDPVFIRRLAEVKLAAAAVNMQESRAGAKKWEAVQEACRDVIRGDLNCAFIVDAIQGGAGTSMNMNMNEVIANRALEILGLEKGSYSSVNPNDDVNRCQSTNDVIPTAGKLTCLSLLDGLDEKLTILSEELEKKSEEFKNIVKLGRTHLQDAVPMRLGQAFRAHSVRVRGDRDRISGVRGELYHVNMGATAIGTMLNATPYYRDHIIEKLAEITGYPLQRSEDLFAGTEYLDSFAAASSAVKVCALDLSKMCNDLRLLSSGPKGGLQEVRLPERQSGSSIMPGKVNPVIPEVVTQAAFRIVGNDVTISMAAESGQLELNVFEPVVFYSLFESIRLLTNAADTLTRNCVAGITADPASCREHLDRSTGLCTALTPYIGYRRASDLAYESLREGVPVQDLVLKYGFMTKAQIDQVLNPEAMTD